MTKAKWVLVLKASVIVIAALIAKAVVGWLELDTIAVSPLITALLGGVIFTLAIIFGGVLSDFKESEKIPGEISASVKSLYKDFRLVSPGGEGMVDIKSHMEALVQVISSNLNDGNTWELKKINYALDRLDEDIHSLSARGVPPPLIARMRNEITGIDRLSNRVETIMRTSFIPAAYAISEIVVGISILTLLFTRIEPYYESVVLFGFAVFILVSLLLLIKDMDNPFEGHAKVDLSLLRELEDYLAASPPRS